MKAVTGTSVSNAATTSSRDASYSGFTGSMGNGGLPGINEANTSMTSKNSPSSSGVLETRHANDRTTSSASVTAIRGGTEGSRSSPLANQVMAATGAQGAEQKSTTPGTGPNHTTSVSPGSEKDGVGHPSSTGTGVGASGSPNRTGSTMTPDGTIISKTGKVMSSSGSQTPASSGKPESSGLGAGTAGSIDPKGATTLPVSPRASSAEKSQIQQQSPKTVADANVGHNRTASTVSSEGSKKKGFLSRLKEKL